MIFAIANLVLMFTLALYLHDAATLSRRLDELGLYDDLDHRA